MWSAFGAVVVSNTRVSHTAFAMSRGDLVVVCSSTLGGNTESAMSHSLLRQLGSSSTAS